MGELHLEVIVDRMLREFKVDATVGKPQVAYRETITQTVVKHTYTHKKQTGGSGQYAEVTIDLEPTGPGGGYRSEEHTSELKSLMRSSYAVFCLKKKIHDYQH